MATVVSSTEIPPGGEGKIEVKISSTERASGRISKTIVVNSNDPNNPVYRLKLSADVETLLGLDPQMLDVGMLTKGTESNHTIKLTGKLAKRVKITNWSTDNSEMVGARIKRFDEVDGLEVTVKAPATDGIFHGSMKIETDHEKLNALQIWIQGRVEADIVYDKRLVVFQPGDTNLEQPFLQRILTAISDPFLNQRVLTRVRLRSLTNRPFQIKRVEDTSGVVFAFARKDPETDDWLVYMKQIGNPKTLFGKLYLYTDREDQPTLFVRYQALMGNYPPPGMGNRRSARAGRPTAKNR